MCDASYCHTNKVAGYGYWIASGRGKKGGGGPIQSDVDNNNIAEMMAIYNAVWKGLEADLIHNGDELLIQSDSLRAMDSLAHRLRTPPTPQESQVVEYFDRMCNRWGLNVRFKHVKGHSGVQDQRSAANRHCDRRAKDGLRLARLNKIKREVEEILK